MRLGSNKFSFSICFKPKKKLFLSFKTFKWSIRIDISWWVRSSFKLRKRKKYLKWDMSNARELNLFLSLKLILKLFINQKMFLKIVPSFLLRTPLKKCNGIKIELSVKWSCDMDKFLKTKKEVQEDHHESIYKFSALLNFTFFHSQLKLASETRDLPTDYKLSFSSTEDINWYQILAA